MAQDTNTPAPTVEGRSSVGPQVEDGELLITNVWVRPTAAGPQQDMGAMDMAEETPEAMGGMQHNHGGMAGAEATPETMASMNDGGMNHGGMSEGKVTAGYMTIENTTGVDYTLVSATTTFNALTEIHEVIMDGDVMRMRQLEGGLNIPAGTSAQLKPGGYHVMLLDVTRDVYPDSAAALRLVFQGSDGSTLERTVAAVVTDFPPEPGLIVATDAVALPYTPSEEGAQPGMALYVTLINLRAPTVNLVSAQLDIGETVEVRESYLDGGVIATRVIPFVPVPVQARLLLQPNGYFLLASGLTTMPMPGDAFLATLLFEDGSEMMVPFVVGQAE
ncbi:MAG: copper chaperone PCu(A)C [Chloroflexi bacterium]|nr:copper chaperone PCu(A)C [Chloroflexota bacterium]